MRTVLLCGKKAAGRVALVDDNDYDLVSAYPWRISGSYAGMTVRRPDGQRGTVYMHRVITGWPRTDHINHNGLDNRRHNLRPATDAQNARNQRKHSTPTSSRFKGVSWDRGRSAWLVTIMVNGHSKNLGRYASETDAALAYDAGAREHFGEFACVNFPGPGEIGAVA